MNFSLSPAGFWQRLTRRRTPEPALPQTSAPEISYSDLFGAPPPPTPRETLADLTLEAPYDSDAVPTRNAEADADIMAAWAMRELGRWHTAQLDLAHTQETYARFNAEDPEIFLYRFEFGQVEKAEKPPGLDIHPVTMRRAHKYLDFFRDVARLLPQDFRTMIAMGLGDKVEFVPDVPVFCFQKRRGNVTILLPDIDFLDFNFYEGEDVTDTLAYADKADRAIFVGGTTGGLISEAVARQCSLPRLRAAKYFWGHERVDMLLPQIVQTTSPEAQAILEQMPFCRPGRMSWRQQFLNRFLISIDGNGATCSRVAISMHSNSVLLKYDSEELLYYFQGMQPWLHYIPIAREQDIERAFYVEDWSPGRLECIAREGRAFAQRFLTRDAVTRYTAQLLQLYPACLTSNTGAPRPQTARQTSAKSKLFLIAHLEGKGDTQANTEGWVGLDTPSRRIEGFSISCAEAYWRAHVTYQAILPDNSIGPRVQGDSYCGTRGKQEPLHGFVIHLAEAAPEKNLAYQGVFSDGAQSALLPPGSLCVSPTHAALVAMRVVLT